MSRFVSGTSSRRISLHDVRLPAGGGRARGPTHGGLGGGRAGMNGRTDGRCADSTRTGTAAQMEV